jgi:hypothetical protein
MKLEIVELFGPAAQVQYRQSPAINQHTIEAENEKQLTVTEHGSDGAQRELGLLEPERTWALYPA